MPIHLDMAYVDLRDSLAVHVSPEDQQRDQTRNDNQRKDRCGEANAWSGKIEEAGKVVEQARGVGKDLSYSFHSRQQTSRLRYRWQRMQ